MVLLYILVVYIGEQQIAIFKSLKDNCAILKGSNCQKCRNIRAEHILTKKS